MDKSPGKLYFRTHSQVTFASILLVGVMIASFVVINTDVLGLREKSVFVVVGGVSGALVIAGLAWAFDSFRWRRIKQEAIDAQYLLCPTCGHDLRGCVLEGTSIRVPQTFSETEIRKVKCPECGDIHVLGELMGIWEAELPS